MIYRFILILVILIGLPNFVKSDSPFEGLVTVTPSKLELTANPGETIRREFIIANHSNNKLDIVLKFENLESQPIFPLVPYLSATERNFTLPQNSKVVVPVLIQLPEAMSPGGFYGTAVFSITTSESSITNTHVVTRLAPLLFLRVNGPVLEAGTLLDFNLIGPHFRFSSNQPVFYLTYQNTGNVYLNPYGLIGLKNKISGQQISLPIEPWFVLPDTTRIREIAVKEKLVTGWYQAQLSLNHGYNKETDIKTVNFVVINPAIFLMILLILASLIFIVINRFRKIIFAVILITVLTNITWAQVASSSNYRLQADSLNFGGGLSNSTNYNLESTFGETATGNGISVDYGMNAGYQQMVTSSISITVPSDVTLSGISGTGSSNSSVAWTVTTDNSAGYTLSIKARSNPALVAGSDSFGDYSPSGANPDYNWSVGASASAFGFSPEGVDTASRYLDNGSSCGTGVSNASDQCWDGFSTTNRTIASRSSSNTPSGAATTVKLKAEVGNTKTQPVGSYVATLTVTATPQ